MYNLKDFQKAFVLQNLPPTLTETHVFIHFFEILHRLVTKHVNDLV